MQSSIQCLVQQPLEKHSLLKPIFGFLLLKIQIVLTIVVIVGLIVAGFVISMTMFEVVGGLVVELN